MLLCRITYLFAPKYGLYKIFVFNEQIVSNIIYKYEYIAQHKKRSQLLFLCNSCCTRHSYRTMSMEYWVLNNNNIMICTSFILPIYTSHAFKSFNVIQNYIITPYYQNTVIRTKSSSSFVYPSIILRYLLLLWDARNARNNNPW